MNHRSMFITLEGVDGSGKTTQSRRLAEWLRAEQSADVVLTREPGGTELGTQIRKMLLDPHGNPGTATELLLYAADRAEHVDKVIRPALTRGAHVICDRYLDSTIAYQGHGRGHDLATLKMLHKIATDDLMPDITFVIDVPPDLGAHRVHQAKGSADRLEQAGEAFHTAVRTGYFEVAFDNPHRCILIDGRRDENTVFDLILEVMQFRFREWTRAPDPQT